MPRLPAAVAEPVVAADEAARKALQQAVAVAAVVVAKARQQPVVAVVEAVTAARVQRRPVAVSTVGYPVIRIRRPTRSAKIWLRSESPIPSSR